MTRGGLINSLHAFSCEVQFNFFLFIRLQKTTGSEDELIETQPDSPLPEPLAAGEKTGVDAEQSTYNSEKPSEDESDSNSERSIDWQLLSKYHASRLRKVPYKTSLAP